MSLQQSLSNLKETEGDLDEAITGGLGKLLDG